MDEQEYRQAVCTRRSPYVGEEGVLPLRILRPIPHHRGQAARTLGKYRNFGQARDIKAALGA